MMVCYAALRRRCHNQACSAMPALCLAKSCQYQGPRAHGRELKSNAQTDQLRQKSFVAAGYRRLLEFTVAARLACQDEALQPTSLSR